MGLGLCNRACPHHLDTVVEVSPHPVHLVDKGNAGNFVLVGLAPHSLGLGLHARHGIKDRHGPIQHTQGTFNLHACQHMGAW